MINRIKKFYIFYNILQYLIKYTYLGTANLFKHIMIMTQTLLITRNMKQKMTSASTFGNLEMPALKP